MNRRSFLSGWAARVSPARPNGSDASDARRPAAATLAPYVPSATAPWNAVRAGHLLRRATFMPRWADVAAVVAMSPSEAVDLLITTPSSPAPPTVADNITESLAGLDQTLRAALQTRWKNDVPSLRTWQAN